MNEIKRLRDECEKAYQRHQSACVMAAYYAAEYEAAVDDTRADWADAQRALRMAIGTQDKLRKHAQENYDAAYRALVEAVTRGETVLGDYYAMIADASNSLEEIK